MGVKVMQAINSSVPITNPNDAAIASIMSTESVVSVHDYDAMKATYQEMLREKVELLDAFMIAFAKTRGFYIDTVEKLQDALNQSDLPSEKIEEIVEIVRGPLFPPENDSSKAEEVINYSILKAVQGHRKEDYEKLLDFINEENVRGHWGLKEK